MADGTDGTRHGPGAPQGARVGGRYEVGELLGRGGMAEVRRGTDVRLGRTVAVKRLRTDLASDATFQARFRREAQAAAGLNHANIVSVYDTGEEMAPDGSHVQPYIVMEYVEGRTLREVLNDGRKLLPERALEITSGVLAALDYSHRAGIIHRDIKPANVMLTPSGEVKVMDFGIARAISEGTSTMTQTSAVVGTAQYLSPEQARGETVDSRSDVYSTGCLLYELLTGRPPFVGDSAFAVAYQHVREEPDPPRTHNPDLPPEVDAIVMKALAKKLDQRYQSAAEMRADIQRYLDGHPVDAATVLAAAPVVSAAEPEGTSIFRPVAEDEPAEDEEERRRWPLVVGVLLVLALLVGGLALAATLLDDSAAEVSVPDVSDLNLNQATRRLESAGLQLGNVDRESSDEVQAGLVLAQDPGPDAVVEEGSEVDLVLSSGSETTTVPFILGQSRSEAEAALAERNLEGSFREEDSTEPEGTVIETSPNADTEVDIGSTVVVVLSRGPIEVPGVVGETEEDARATLTDAGLRVTVQDDPNSTAESGTVTDQDPAEGQEVARGTRVTITVSRFVEPAPTETPTETPTDQPADGDTGGGGTGGASDGIAEPAPGATQGAADTSDGAGTGEDTTSGDGSAPSSGAQGSQGRSGVLPARTASSRRWVRPRPGRAPGRRTAARWSR